MSKRPVTVFGAGCSETGGVAAERCFVFGPQNMSLGYNRTVVPDPWNQFIDSLKNEEMNWSSWSREHLTTHKPTLEEFGLTRGRLNRYKTLSDGNPSPLVYPLRSWGEAAGFIFYAVGPTYGLAVWVPQACPWIVGAVVLVWALAWYHPLENDLEAIRKYRQAVLAHDAEVAVLQPQFEEELRIFREAKEHRDAERRKTFAWWDALDGRGFEIALADLFQQRGYSVRLTPHSNDGGIDLILNQADKLPILVQCKAHRSIVGLGLIRDFYGAVVHYGEHTESWIVCKSGYTQGAFEFAKGKRLRLLTIQELLESAGSHE